MTLPDPARDLVATEVALVVRRPKAKKLERPPHNEDGPYWVWDPERLF